MITYITDPTDKCVQPSHDLNAQTHSFMFIALSCNS